MLCIPTAFCAYSGITLDEKTPLLRSNQALISAVRKVLRFFKMNKEPIFINVGPEQEYFLVDEENYKKRTDLKLCGRTLFGARCPKE